MQPAVAVIGAGFGDEGKGLATDYFVRKYGDKDCVPLVARGNGGAQAGHTVVDGKKRHVFGHVGSGTFARAPTYLASNFIVNPLLLEKELTALKKLQCAPEIYVSPDCRVTTIWDMAINSLIELSRGSGRHGSCGAGINETVTRHAAGFYLDVKTVMASDNRELIRALSLIKLRWTGRRLGDLDLHLGSFKGLTREEAESVAVYYGTFQADPRDIAADLRANISTLQLLDPKQLSDQDQPVIIEGAQGLMLDEYLGVFPHVTRSVTGLASSVRAAYECGRTQVQPVYITRTYATRHGAGKLAHDGVAPTSKTLVDTTNVDNPWQGSIRFAPLDLLSMKGYVEFDVDRGVQVGQAFSIEVLPPKIFLTCMDQLGETVKVSDGRLTTLRAEDLPRKIEKALGFPVSYISRGPTAADVQAV